MSLDTLPEELMMMIVRELDLKSIVNLFDAGNSHIKATLASRGVIKKLNFSLSTLATINSLKTDFFNAMAANLQELNLTGIQDLNKNILLPAMQRMNSLLTLNVTYTHLTICDFIEIYEHCPTIKNIAIDYQISNDKKKPFSLNELEKCQDIFAKLENVLFVGSAEDLVYSTLPRKLLAKTKLNSLTYTLVKENMCTLYKYEFVRCDFITCKNFNVFNLFWRGFETDVEIAGPNYQGVIKDLHTYDYILLRSDITKQIECSPVFKKFFEENFQPEAVIKQCFGYHYIGVNSVCMFWNKELTEFNAKFFKKLFNVIKPLFPSYKRTSEDYGPINNDWVWVRHSKCSDRCNFGFDEAPPLKKKIRPITLDYSILLRNVQKVELSIYFFEEVRVPVKLNEGLNFLKKLTYLELNGSVKYYAHFFDILFKYSVNLETFNFEAAACYPCSNEVAKALKNSNTLKNLRLSDKNICFKTLMSGFSKCPTLANIVISDTSRDPININVGDPTRFIKNCSELYYFCIEANTSESLKEFIVKLLNCIKDKLERDHLVIKFFRENSEFIYSYDPFIEVFKLDKIKYVPIGF